MDDSELTTREQITYGTGYFGVTLITLTVTMWLSNLYLPPEEGSVPLLPGMFFFGHFFNASILFGFAKSVGRFVDAVTDPFLGYLSDNTKSKWGRRRPYIIFGAPLLVIVFVSLFLPNYPAGHPGNLYHLLATISLFFLFYTIVVTPYLSLLPEIGKSAADRFLLAGWQVRFNLAGAAVAMILGDVIRHYAGHKWMVIFFAILALGAFWIAGFKTKERPKPISGERFGFGKALIETFRNRPFLIYLIALTFVWFGFNLMLNSLRHIVVALMGFKTMGVAISMFSTLIVAVLCIPLVFRYAKKHGPKKTFLSLVSLFAPLMFMLFLLRSPMVGEYSHYLGFMIFGLMGIPTSAFFIIPHVLMGEVIDYDETRTGKRLEAIYYSAQAFIMKGGLAF